MGSTGSGKRPSNFKLNINDEIIDEKRNLIVIDRYFKVKKCKSIGCNEGFTNRTKKYYKVHCNKCNVDFTMEQNNLIGRKDNCPCCSGKKVFEGFNDVATIRPDLVKYFKNKKDATKYTAMSNKKVKFICPDCNEEKLMEISNLSTHGLMCTNCSDGISYPNKYIISLLTQLGLDFETEKIFKWSEGRKYDDYIIYNNKHIICENMGLQHYEECTFTTRTLQEEMLNDEFKRNIAINNQIDFYIILDCRYSTSNYIQTSVMNSVLPLILNFQENDIDWSECDYFATKSLIKEVCKTYNDFTISTAELAKQYKLSESTIRNYLYKGNVFKLCNYSSKKIAKNNKINQICDFKNNNPDKAFTEIAQILKYNKYTVRNLLIYGFNNGLCNYDISLEIENNKKSSIKNLKRERKKQVFVYDLDYNLNGIYDSGADAIEQNKEMLWTIKGIQKVCSGYQKSHRNYIFSYTNLNSETQQDSLLLCSNE